MWFRYIDQLLGSPINENRVLLLSHSQIKARATHQPGQSVEIGVGGRTANGSEELFEVRHSFNRSISHDTRLQCRLWIVLNPVLSSMLRCGDQRRFYRRQ
jgi:hypothetical protein